MKHQMPPHCEMEGCCVGVFYGKCQACGFKVYAGGGCPATEDDEPMRWEPDPSDEYAYRQVSGPRIVLTAESPGYNVKAKL